MFSGDNGRTAGREVADTIADEEALVVAAGVVGPAPSGLTEEMHVDGGEVNVTA